VDGTISIQAAIVPILFALAEQIPTCLRDMLMKWLSRFSAIRAILVLSGALLHELRNLIVRHISNGGKRTEGIGTRGHMFDLKRLKNPRNKLIAVLQ
jgi:hypothetical protein